MSLRVRAKIASLTNPALRLVFAVEKNDVGAIQRELRNGADPNFLTLEGATMLMAAVASACQGVQNGQRRSTTHNGGQSAGE